MNKGLLKKDLKDALKKHGLDILYFNIDHEKISNDFFTTNNNIFDSSEFWFENVEVDKINWLLSEYGTGNITLDFPIGDHILIIDAVINTLSSDLVRNKINFKDEDVENKYNDFEETTLEDLKEELPESIFNSILENILYYISQQDFYEIEQYLSIWFDECYPDETFNEIETLAYWTVYFKPAIWDENVAWEVGLFPFSFEGENYLALAGCGMDLSPKLDAYQALTDGTIPSDSKFRRESGYAKHVVGERRYNKVMEIIKCDPIIHIKTEVSDE
jgi:hypothetical protein